MAAYARTAEHLNATGWHTDAHDDEDAARRWLEWLATTPKRWLIVLDNLQTPSDLADLWPPHTRTSRIVVTTQHRGSALDGTGRHRIEVDLFTPAESLALITERLARRPRQADGAAELAEALGHLPVAIAQAAAYLTDRPDLTCTTYLQLWNDRHTTLADVLPEAAELPDGYHATVASTWSLSIELANQQSPAGWHDR
ncbi:hypothetical protein [Crossiella sp. NPDC003009]